MILIELSYLFIQSCSRAKRQEIHTQNLGVTCLEDCIKEKLHHEICF